MRDILSPVNDIRNRIDGIADPLDGSACLGRDHTPFKRDITPPGAAPTDFALPLAIYAVTA